MGHQVGLNYSSVRICIDYRAGKKRDRAELFYLVQAMEHGVLKDISKKK